MSKRTYETGTLTYRGNNKWLLRVSAGTGLGGKRNRYSKTVTAKKRSEAERLLQEFIAEKAMKTEEASMTVSALIDMFTETHVSTLRYRTQEWYKEKVVRIRDALGRFKLQELKPAHIQTFYKVLADKSPNAQKFAGMPSGFSFESIRHYHRALSAMLNWAYKQEYIDKTLIG